MEPTAPEHENALFDIAGEGTLEHNPDAVSNDYQPPQTTTQDRPVEVASSEVDEDPSWRIHARADASAMFGTAFSVTYGDGPPHALEDAPSIFLRAQTPRTGEAADRLAALVDIADRARVLRDGGMSPAKKERLTDELAQAYEDYVYEFGPIHKQQLAPRQRRGWSPQWQDNLEAINLGTAPLSEAERELVSDAELAVAFARARADDVKLTRDLEIFSTEDKALLARVEAFDFATGTAVPGAFFVDDRGRENQEVASKRSLEEPAQAAVGQARGDFSADVRHDGTTASQLDDLTAGGHDSETHNQQDDSTVQRQGGSSPAVSKQPENTQEEGAFAAESPGLPPQTATPSHQDVTTARARDGETPDNSPVNSTDAQDVSLADLLARTTNARDRAGQPHDFSATHAVLPPSGAKSRADANLDAIELLATLAKENRWASPEEQTVLAKYSAWGAAAGIFNPSDATWASRHKRLTDLVGTGRLYRDLQATTLTAYYTPDDITDVVWSAIASADLTEEGQPLRVLEPGSGIGGMMAHALDNATVVGVEKDPIAAAITSHLYPHHLTVNTGFEEVTEPSDSFHAAVGNVPFGNVTIFDAEHNPNNEQIHDYFINKTLAHVAPGGYAALITATGTADKATSQARQRMIDRADVVSAVRLPVGTFKRQSGTNAAADLLVFRVREDDEAPSQLSRQFLASDRVNVDGHYARVNQLFADDPTRVLGTLEVVSGPHGPTAVAQGDLEGLGTKLAARVLDDIEEYKTKEERTARPVVELQPAQFHTVARATDKDVLLGEVRYLNDDNTTVFQAFTEQGWQPLKVARKNVAETKMLMDLRTTALALRRAYSERANDEQTAALQRQLRYGYERYVDKFGPINRYTLPNPKAPTAKQQAERLEKLLSTWRNEVYAEAHEMPPAEVLAELEAQAALPTASTTKIQAHLRTFKNDPFLPVLIALEDFDDDTQTATPAALFDRDPARRAATLRKTDDLAEAAKQVHAVRGSLDLEAIASVTGISVEEVTQRLPDEEIAFRDPDNPESFIPAVKYLSGNVLGKLARARRLAEDDPRLNANVDALKEAQPPRITQGITVRPGGKWIPAEYYQQYLSERIGGRPEQWNVVFAGDRWSVEYTGFYDVGGPHDQQWGVIVAPNRNYNYEAPQKYRKFKNHGVACHTPSKGVARTAVQIFESAMNNSVPTLNYSKEYKVANDLPETSMVVHQHATNFASRRARSFKEDFADWIMADDSRREHIIDLYNQTFNTFVAPHYDGVGRDIPGLGDSFTPYDYQLNAVERMTNEHSVLLNHVVGAGKTGSMLMGAMEVKRLGIAEQPWIVVPNHIADQVTREAAQWFPHAKILSAAGKNDKEDRRRFLAQSLASDWDMVIVPQSVFNLIEPADETVMAYIDDKLNMLEDQIYQLQTAHGDKAPSVKQAEQAKAKLLRRLKDLTSGDKDAGLSFNDLRADYLIVDEAHMYKNLARACENAEVSHTGSKRATDLEMKLSIIRDKNEAAGLDPYAVPTVTFATGTPVANNMAEIWVMAKYLMPQEMERLGIDDINQFVTTFIQEEEMVEVKPSGTGLRSVQRTTGFVNLPELSRMNSQFMDTVSKDAVASKLPQLGDEGKNTVIEFEPEQELKDFIADLDYRADTDWKSKKIGSLEPAEIDNMLKIINDGTNATLDPRLANIRLQGQGARTVAVAAQIMNQWDQHRHDVFVDPVTGNESAKPGGLQVVFCDRGTPKNDGSFSVYQGLKDELVSQGMDPDRIQFVHDWDKDRAELWRRCNEGEVDVLIGSTEKLGTGANIQRRLCALHHMDVPWRPADLEQREGRILRQGNQNDRVEIFNYIAAGTMDALRWQTVFRKAKGIEQFFNADLDMRHMEAMADSPAQVAAQYKAMATGDKRYVRLVDLERDVEELDSQYGEWIAANKSTEFTRNRCEKELDRLSSLEADVDQVEAKLEAFGDNREREYRLGRGTFSDVTTDRGAAARGLTRVIDRGFKGGQRAQLSINGIEIDMDVLQTGWRDEVQFVIPGRRHPIRINRPTMAKAKQDLADAEFDARRKGEELVVPASCYGLLQRLDNALNVDALRSDLHQAREMAQADLNAALAMAAPEFAREQEWKGKTKELSELRAELEAYENSDAVKQREQERLDRLVSQGRRPGWSLRLNPTEGLAKLYQTDKEAVRAAQWDMEDTAVAIDEQHRLDEENTQAANAEQASVASGELVDADVSLVGATVGFRRTMLTPTRSGIIAEELDEHGNATGALEVVLPEGYER